MFHVKARKQWREKFIYTLIWSIFFSFYGEMVENFFHFIIVWRWDYFSNLIGYLKEYQPWTVLSIFFLRTIFSCENTNTYLIMKLKNGKILFLLVMKIHSTSFVFEKFRALRFMVNEHDRIENMILFFDYAIVLQHLSLSW